ncbi:MAG: hypothetical protein ACJ780_02430 [Solirubrobacteraceae bacterium]
MGTIANRTGALSRDTLAPELSFPVKVPSATTSAAVARNLVIFAVIETRDDVPPPIGLDLAFAAGATTATKASAEKPATTSLRIVPCLLHG